MYSRSLGFDACFWVVYSCYAQELEESRASWNVVKAKTAESEEQWVKLKADFAERKRCQLCTPLQIMKPEDNNSKIKTSICATTAYYLFPFQTSCVILRKRNLRHGCVNFCGEM